MKIFVWLFLFIAAFLIAYTLFFRISDKKVIGIISPLAQTFGQIESLVPNGISRLVKKELNDAEGEYAVVIKNLKDGTSFVHNKDTEFDSASLYKLWVMAEAFEQIKSGSLSKEKELSQMRSVLFEKYKLSTDSADFEDKEVKMTVSYAIEQMITVSDNDAALLLSWEVGLSNVAQFLKNNGFANSSIAQPPATTASDIALFFEKLYKGELVSRDASDEMLEILSRQRLNDRIPKYLPQNTKVAHKTGELGAYKHDAGIVYSEEGDYIIVVLSKTKSQKKAAETISKISEAVYNYFNE